MKFDRLHDMEQYISENGATSLEELCRHYDVSMSTIRRDIAELVQSKNFSKVYGGVAAGCQPLAKIHSTGRPAQSEYSGQIIGKLASSLVQDEMSVFLDSGSTAPQILPFIAEKRDVTVISCSLAALFEAAKYPSLHIIALGGFYNRVSSSFLGGNTSEELSRMSIDLVFLDAVGITLARGLTSTSYSETENKRAVIKWNRNLVLMADHHKFGRDALLPFCNFDDLDAIITDQPLEEEFMQASIQRHIRVIVPQTKDRARAAYAAIPSCQSARQN